MAFARGPLFHRHAPQWPGTGRRLRAYPRHRSRSKSHPPALRGRRFFPPRSLIRRPPRRLPRPAFGSNQRRPRLRHLRHRLASRPHHKIASAHLLSRQARAPHLRRRSAISRRLQRHGLPRLNRCPSTNTISDSATRPAPSTAAKSPTQTGTPTCSASRYPPTPSTNRSLFFSASARALPTGFFSTTLIAPLSISERSSATPTPSGLTPAN